MAFIKTSAETCYGFIVPNAYLKITRVEFNSRRKSWDYAVCVYASKKAATEGKIICDYHNDTFPFQIGGDLPDILRMIYEDIKLKAQDAEAYPEIAEKFADCTDDVAEELPSPSYAELAAATDILMGGNES